MEVVAEFGNKVFSQKCQRGFVLITAGIRDCIYCFGSLFTSVCASVTPCSGGAVLSRNFLVHDVKAKLSGF